MNESIYIQAKLGQKKQKNISMEVQYGGDTDHDIREWLQWRHIRREILLIIHVCKDSAHQFAHLCAQTYCNVAV